VLAAVASGTAAAATRAVFFLTVHARLAPGSGTKATGRFSGVLVREAIAKASSSHTANPVGNAWRLVWKLSLPPLEGPVTGTLRIAGANGAAPVMRILCTQCALTPRGALTLTASQESRLAGSHAVVAVRALSATLRGVVRLAVQIPTPSG
jgi:hypothetical protein